MQTAVLGNENKYDITAPKFQTAFAFLKRSDFAKLADGWYELDNGVRASVQHYTTFPAADLDFETHVHYFDIQYMVSGQEMIGVVNAEGLTVKIPTTKTTTSSFMMNRPSPAVFLCAPATTSFWPRRTHTNPDAPPVPRFLSLKLL